VLTTFLYRESEKMERLSDAICILASRIIRQAGLFTMRPMIIHGTVGGSRQKAQVSLYVGVYATIKSTTLIHLSTDYCTTTFSSSGVSESLMDVYMCHFVTFSHGQKRNLKLAGPLQTTTENLFPAEYLKGFILSLF